MNGIQHHCPLKLRACEPEDLEVMYEIENDTAIWETGCTTVPYSRYSLKQYLEQTQYDIYADKQVRLMIEDTRSRQVLGMADLYDFDPMHKRAATGIVIRSAYRRQGFGRAALRLLTHYAFGQLHMHQLYAFIADDNTASLRLFERCGFTRSGRLTDWLETPGRTYKDAWLLQQINPHA